MATEQQISRVLGVLSEIQSCRQCGTRLRFGDWECPHCGADVEEDLRQWAARLVDAVVGEST